MSPKLVPLHDDDVGRKILMSGRDRGALCALLFQVCSDFLFPLGTERAISYRYEVRYPTAPLVQQRSLRIWERGVALLDVCPEHVDGPEGTTATQSTAPVATVILKFVLEPGMAVLEELEVTLVWSQCADVRFEVGKCMPPARLSG